ncbi:MAG: methyl-accepting chemotaxis protein [Desulfobacterales bacterium]|nr:methyl-accepting chemotaxis protein [Desulfobacterales bacterium]
MKTQRKLKNLLINKHIQMRITLYYVVLTVLSSLFMGFIVFISIWPALESFVPTALVNELWYSVLFKLFLLGIPVMLCSMAVCIIITHRIAGPLYQIEQKIARLLNGETITPIKLRQYDELQQLSELINKLLLNYQKK